MNFDDPKLTAYALDELDEAERSTIARVTAESPEARRVVADTQKLARILRSEYGLELERETIARKKVAAVNEEAFWSKAGPLAIAALLAVLAVIGAVALSSSKSGMLRLSGSSLSPHLAGARAELHEFGSVEGEDAALASQNQSAEADAGPYAYTGERPFVSAVSRPRSSVRLLVNSASYLDVRRSINGGVLPPRDAVRIEGIINHFPYDYPQPTAEEPFSLNADVVICPWETSHRLVRIGLKGNEAIAVSEDSGIEVEFNPRYVASYRLIGYDRQESARHNLNEASVGSEHVPTGYALTVLYEVVVRGSKRPTTATISADASAQSAEHLLSVKLRLTTPTHDAIPSVGRVVMDNESAFAGAPQDLKFVAAVAEFGMILRDSEYKGNGTFESVLQWAVEGKGADREGYRADFIELVRKTQALTKG
jgi:Uncharacterized protein YfbK, C-terminal/von Willebrand factor